MSVAQGTAGVSGAANPRHRRPARYAVAVVFGILIFLALVGSSSLSYLSLDRIPVGAGTRGPVTERLQKEFFAVLDGEAEDRYGWLTPIPVEAGATR